MPSNILKTSVGAEELLWEQSRKWLGSQPSPEIAFISILEDKIVGLRNHKSELDRHLLCSYSHKEKSPCESQPF